MNINNKERQSNFELLRIVAMFFIVLYHLLLYSAGNSGCYERGLQTLWLPLHVGVIIFVLISGYFHIHPNLKGLIKLLLPVIVYYVPIELIVNYFGNGGIKKSIDIISVLDHTPYWFIRTYLLLYFISPAINKYLDGISESQRIKLVLVLAYSSLFLGLFSNDLSLRGGKNVLNFIFIYVLGDTYVKYQEIWRKIKEWRLVASYLLTNVAIISFYYLTGKGFRYLFEYSSPILIFNASLLFLIFVKIRLRSRLVNYVSSSILAVYLIHEEPTFLKQIIKPTLYRCIDYQAESAFTIYLKFVAISMAIMAVCVTIDKAFKPLWDFGNRYIQLMVSKTERLCNKNII